MNQCDHCGQTLYDEELTCGTCGFGFCSHECKTGHILEHSDTYIDDALVPDYIDPLIAKANQILEGAGFDV